MSGSAIYSVLLVIALFAANLPWLSERFLLTVARTKTAAWRWLEWLLYYGMTALLAMALEYQSTGSLYHQSWEFYVATLCLFAVFALPGFIYHYDLRKSLNR